LISILNKYKQGANSGSVLLVDEDPTVREIVRRMLEGEGWGVSEAEHGRAALESLAKTTPNLILLDHLMPEMDWFESIEELHRNPEWNQEPVLAVTAKDVTR
jgi:CheY-like chemotaxis protein